MTIGIGDVAGLQLGVVMASLVITTLGQGAIRSFDQCIVMQDESLLQRLLLPRTAFAGNCPTGRSWRADKPSAHGSTTHNVTGHRERSGCSKSAAIALALRPAGRRQTIWACKVCSRV